MPRTSVSRLGLLLLMSSITPVHAQKGIASPGYYPIGYNGDIFTGQFVSSDTADQVKLDYKKGDKTKSFDGKLESPCHAPTKDKHREVKELRLSSIPAGTVLTAYYAPAKIKVAGTKVRTDLIWGIRFDTWNGLELTDPNRPIILCSHPQALPYKAFN
jgi:hypothetical protein